MNHENKVRVVYGAKDYIDVPLPLFEKLVEAQQQNIKFIKNTTTGKLISSNFHHFFYMSDLIIQYLKRKNARYCKCGNMLKSFEETGGLEICETQDCHSSWENLTLGQSIENVENRRNYGIPDEVSLTAPLLLKLETAKKQELLPSGQKLLGEGSISKTTKQIIEEELMKAQQEERKLQIYLYVIHKDDSKQEQRDYYVNKYKEQIAEWKKTLSPDQMAELKSYRQTFRDQEEKNRRQQETFEKEYWKKKEEEESKPTNIDSETEDEEPPF